MGLASMINNQAKNKPVEEALVDLFFNAIKMQEKPRPMKPNIKPSKAKCLRQMYYILTSAPLDKVSATDPKLSFIQKDGTFSHSYIQSVLSSKEAKSMGLEFRKPEDVVAVAAANGIHTRVVESDHDKDNPYECNCFNDDYGVSFMFDGAVFFKGTSPGIEIKTEDHFKWIKRVVPEEDHIEQATYYSIGLGIDTWIFLYVDRNYKAIKPYKIQITEEMKQYQIDKICFVHHAVGSKELPEACKGNHCKYCAFTRLCKANSDPYSTGA